MCGQIFDKFYVWGAKCSVGGFFSSQSMLHTQANNTNKDCATKKDAQQAAIKIMGVFYISRIPDSL